MVRRARAPGPPGRPAEAGAVTSVGSRGDCYDNALAETIIGLYKTELIRRRGPWKGIDDVEYATLEWVDEPVVTAEDLGTRRIVSQACRRPA